MRLLRHLALLTLIFALAACADKPAPDTSSKDDEVLRAIEHLENRVDKGFAEVNRQIADLRDSSSK